MRSSAASLALLLLGLHGIPGCAQVEQSSGSPFDARTVARHLETPWSLAFAPDGRLFIAERPGRIRIVDHDSLVVRPWAVIPVVESAARGLETGLMGLAIDPRFEQTGRIYICYTHDNGDGTVSNRISVLTEQARSGTGLTVLVPDIPGGDYHNGCRLKFGPDGKLYATTGDATGNRTEAQSAQSLASLAGKVLRLNADGSVPVDNPYAGSYVWSYGHRNAQGLAWHPESGELYATEQGTGEGGNNELNLIEPGKNYGWPEVIGAARDSRFADPLLVHEDALAGATFVSGDRYDTLRGSLVIGTLWTQRLLDVAFGSGHPPAVLGADVLVDRTLGRIRDVVQGPDGFLYVATSNRDGRGNPGPDDDRVLRLMPR